MRCPEYITVLLLMITIDISHARQTPYSSGWIPLTEEEVYSKSRISLSTDSLWSAPKHPGDKINIKFNDVPKRVTAEVNEESDSLNMHAIRNDAIKMTNPDSKFVFDQENVFEAIKPETIKSVNELQCINADCSERETTQDGYIEKLEENEADLKARRSKAIIANRLKEYRKRLSYNEKSNSSEDGEELKKRFTKGITQISKDYKVTEDPAEMLEEGNSSLMKSLGYFYAPPGLNLNIPTQNNITRTFLSILSKHNIKPEDELPNYTLSRKVKDQNPTNAFMFIPVPLRVLPQFNNLKQLSVDPLLAVLMSNYGYYFPGSYGIHSRYRNLYGHLASNNIHNNKPFGSYKIFSDTDSSN